MNTLPPPTWRLLGIAAVGLLLTAVVGIALISAGVFDPRPLGALQAESAPGEKMAPAGEQSLEWAGQALPQPPFSVRLESRRVEGERDVGYGLALGSAQAHLVVAVSPLGYVAIWEQAGSESAGGRIDYMPWQTWPHVRGGEAPNEIQIDVAEAQVSVRLNRELLWQGQWRPQNGDAVGLYAESFGDEARFAFTSLALFH